MVARHGVVGAATRRAGARTPRRTRVELYELVAAAAFRTGRLDLVLGVGELLKARVALRSRLSPGTDAETSDIDAQLAQINAALPEAAAGAAESLRERRRWLVSARAMARARASGTLPEISLAALRDALLPEQTAVSWLWVGSSSPIVLAVAHEGERAAVVHLDPTQQSQLRDYAACLGRRPRTIRKPTRLRRAPRS